MIGRVVAIPESATVLEACEMFLLHKFLAFPVVSADRRLAGVVNVGLFTQEAFDLSERERLDDVFQSLGEHATVGCTAHRILLKPELAGAHGPNIPSVSFCPDARLVVWCCEKMVGRGKI